MDIDADLFEKERWDGEDIVGTLGYTVGLLFFLFFLHATLFFGKAIGSLEFFLTKLSFVLLTIVSLVVMLCLMVPAFAAVIIYLILIARLIRGLVTGLPEVPAWLKNEFEIWKRIWANRGFGKYSLFGGISFYIKLRMRVLAFFCLALSIFLLSYGFYYSYINYHRQYWHEVIFYGQSPQKVYTFLPNKFYTVKSNLMISHLKIENSKQMVYFPIDKNIYHWQKRPIPNAWHIKFTDTTHVTLAMCYFSSPALSELFETFDFEIWENMSNGVRVDTAFFRQYTPAFVYEKNIRLTFPPHYWDE